MSAGRHTLSGEGRRVGWLILYRSSLRAARIACLLEVGLGTCPVVSLPLPWAHRTIIVRCTFSVVCSSVLGEPFRVLKPGGRLQMADILLEPHVTPEEVASNGSWSD